MSTKKIALICASNQNRSMETHCLLLKKGYTCVSSFGTNNKVRLPGPAPDQPLIYDFGTTYAAMIEDLRSRDEELYTQKGLLHMLKRNLKIKSAPERFQDTDKQFDVIVTFEDRVFDIVTETLSDKPSSSYQPVFVFNINVVDNHESAVLGAIDVHHLIQYLDSMDDWIDQLDDILEEFQFSKGKDVVCFVGFY
jgi:RNA polymerase II subunit A C-terminal domain phosphatase SSU72